jgi:hypothetical protein
MFHTNHQLAKNMAGKPWNMAPVNNHSVVGLWMGWSTIFWLFIFFLLYKRMG